MYIQHLMNIISESPQYTNAPGTLFYPSINAQPDSRGQSIIYPNYPGNINMPLRQYGNSISPPPQNHSQQQMQSKNDTSKGSTQSNMYHINLEQQQSVQQHKSHPSQGQPISIEKISDRYHMEMKHDDRKDVRFSHGQAQPPPQGPPPTQQHLGDLYSNLRPIQLPLHSIPLQQNTQVSIPIESLKGECVSYCFFCRVAKSQEVSHKAIQEVNNSHNSNLLPHLKCIMPVIVIRIMKTYSE